jgi:hypothetical protein
MPSLNTAPGREPARVVLDRSTVATVLYVSAFTPAEWRWIGAPTLARYITWPPTLGAESVSWPG